MTIKELRRSLAEKRARGVKQVRVTTVLESLPDTPADAFPELGLNGSRSKRALRGARLAAGTLEGHTYDDPQTYDTEYGPVEVKGALVGTAEAAAILGVERPRIGKWRALGKMPPIVGDLASSPIWLRADIEAMRPETVARRRSPRRGAESGG